MVYKPRLTKKGMDIHNYKRRFDRTLERLEEDKEISKPNKKIILQFKDYCICQGISYGKLDAYLFYLMRYTKSLNKLLKKATKGDIMKFIGELNQTSYSEQTKICFKIVIRKLYKILEGKEEYPSKVKWISTHVQNNHKKLPEELLTEEEVEKIIRTAGTVRNKALLSVLAESGARISEIGTMQIKHVSFEEYGARLNIHGKTGTRKILVVSSTPYLQAWLNQHPLNNDSEAYLWYNPQDKLCLSYARISAILKLATKRAGINKRVYPHLLRHSRATKMANIMTEGAMKQYFGWTQASKVASIYVHMSGKDTDEAVLRANGIEISKKEKPKPILQPKACLRCKTINEATNRFCKLCGFVLDKEEAGNVIRAEVERNQADEIMNKLIKDPEIIELIKNKLKN